MKTHQVGIITDFPKLENEFGHAILLIELFTNHLHKQLYHIHPLPIDIAATLVGKRKRFSYAYTYV